MSASDFCKKAREKLRGNWLKMMLIMFVVAQVADKFGLDRLNYATRTMNVDTPFGFIGNGGVLSLSIPAGNAWIFMGVLFLLGVYSMVMRSGAKKVCLGLMRGGKPKIKDLFLKGLFWKMLWMNILRYVIIGFFICLLIVPGIIVSCAYSMADYLLIQNPTMSPVEALRESRKRMKGYKARYCGLGLSFAGWIILSIFAMGAIARFLPRIVCDCIIEPVASSALAAYIGAACAAFHMYVYGEEI